MTPFVPGQHRHSPGLGEAKGSRIPAAAARAGLVGDDLGGNHLGLPRSPGLEGDGAARARKEDAGAEARAIAAAFNPRAPLGSDRVAVDGERAAEASGCYLTAQDRATHTGTSCYRCADAAAEALRLRLEQELYSALACWGRHGLCSWCRSLVRVRSWLHRRARR